MSCTDPLICNASGKCTNTCDSTATPTGCNDTKLSKCVGGASGACVECVADSPDCPKFNKCINNACMRN